MNGPGGGSIGHGDPGDDHERLDDRGAWARPETGDALHAWIARVLGVEVPRRALLDGHASPFDYLRFAFFGDMAGGALSGGDGPADCVVWANRGGGKTFLGAVATCLDLVFKPGIAVRILGGSLEQSRRMHAHLAALFDRDALRPLVAGKITRDRVTLRNGSSCEVLAQSQTSVRGTRVQKLRCDEVELFDPELWEAAQLVTRSAQCGDVFVRGSVEALSTMHRPHGMMFRIVREASEGSRRLFKWGVVDVLGACADDRQCEGSEPAPIDGEGCDGGRDEGHGQRRGACALLDACAGRAKIRDATGSPAGHIPVRDAIDLRARVGAHTWEAEMLCLRPRRDGCVLPEFDPRVHVAGAFPDDAQPDDARSDGNHSGELVAGVDFGFRAPTVILWGMVDPRGCLWITREHAASEMLLDTTIALLRERPAPAWVGVDPAGRQRHEQTGRSNIQQMRRAGIVVRDARIAMMEGLGLVRARLRPAQAGAAPALMVMARCEKLIESIERYRYPEDRPESLSPIKDGSDHAVDALRYLVQNLDRPMKTATGMQL